VRVLLQHLRVGQLPVTMDGSPLSLPERFA